MNDDEIVQNALKRLDTDRKLLKLFFKTFFNSNSGDYDKDFPEFQKYWKEEMSEEERIKFVKKFVKNQDKAAIAGILHQTKNPIKVWKKVKEYGEQKKQGRVDY